MKPRIMRIMRFTRIMNFNISAGEMLRHRPRIMRFTRSMNFSISAAEMLRQSKDYEVYKDYEL